MVILMHMCPLARNVLRNISSTIRIQNLENTTKVALKNSSRQSLYFSVEVCAFTSLKKNEINNKCVEGYRTIHTYYTVFIASG